MYFCRVFHMFRLNVDVTKFPSTRTVAHHVNISVVKLKKQQQHLHRLFKVTPFRGICYTIVLLPFLHAFDENFSMLFPHCLTSAIMHFAIGESDMQFHSSPFFTLTSIL